MFFFFFFLFIEELPRQVVDAAGGVGWKRGTDCKSVPRGLVGLKKR